MYTTTAILSEKPKGMHSSGLQHTCYLVDDRVVDHYTVFALTKSVIYGTLRPWY